MSLLISAVNQQIEQSLFSAEQTPQGKAKIADACGMIKVASAITAFAVPILAFFLPAVFSVVFCIGLGLVCYDLSNMADNIGDAARQSLQGFKPRSNVDAHIHMLIDDTLIAKRIYASIQ